ncbi:MAG: hypothetical protein SPI12_05265 [Actinomycetaceae bacterium]|nr:hypothetical protein [Actinomycetaceae bacterium]MDY6083253.1 hypothetical protein [Actinomycetaceae bacterium]
MNNRRIADEHAVKGGSLQLIDGRIIPILAAIRTAGVVDTVDRGVMTMIGSVGTIRVMTPLVIAQEGVATTISVLRMVKRAEAVIVHNAMVIDLIVVIDLNGVVQMNGTRIAGTAAMESGAGRVPGVIILVMTTVTSMSVIATMRGTGVRVARVASKAIAVDPLVKTTDSVAIVSPQIGVDIGIRHGATTIVGAEVGETSVPGAILVRIPRRIAGKMTRRIRVQSRRIVRPRIGFKNRTSVNRS